MKTTILSVLLLVVCFMHLNAQEISNSDSKVSTSQTLPSKWFVGLGVNTLDNGESKAPFNTKNFAFQTPFFITLERSLKSNFSISLSAATNYLTVKNSDRFYFGLDLSGRYYFDDYLFDNKNIETYGGLGFGRFYLQNNGNNTINLSLGGRYWFAKSFAVSFQGIGKKAVGPVNRDVLNYYEYNLGLVWRSNSTKNGSN